MDGLDDAEDAVGVLLGRRDDGGGTSLGCVPDHRVAYLVHVLEDVNKIELGGGALGSGEPALGGDDVDVILFEVVGHLEGDGANFVELGVQFGDEGCDFIVFHNA